MELSYLKLTVLRYQNKTVAEPKFVYISPKPSSKRQYTQFHSNREHEKAQSFTRDNNTRSIAHQILDFSTPQNPKEKIRSNQAENRFDYYHGRSLIGNGGSRFEEPGASIDHRGLHLVFTHKTLTLGFSFCKCSTDKDLAELGTLKSTSGLCIFKFHEDGVESGLSLDYRWKRRILFCF